MAFPTNQVGFLYVRLSEKDKKNVETSITNQISDGKGIFEKTSNKLRKIFNEGFHSGKDRKRKEFNRMIEAVKVKLADFIMVKDDTRFCRDVAFLSDTLVDLKARGIGVYTFSGDDLTKDLTMSRIRGTIAEEKIDKGSREQKNLMERKIKDREIFTRPPLGYNVNHKIVDGKIVKCGWKVHRKGKKIVNKIFNKYLSGVSAYTLADEYKMSAVNVYNILKNKTYISIYECSLKRKDSKGKVVSREVKSFKLKYSPLVSVEVFEKVQEKLYENRRSK